MLKLILFCFVLFPLLASEQIVYEKIFKLYGTTIKQK